ncbi:hypothetical protein GCM10010191_05640 [Actinomadura vinacea]|uniref:Uncharacterized protein n=1 Tax=Actinomadura vinacea TaxID=115336 RepID=A0ABN3ICX6_9ACTN
MLLAIWASGLTVSCQDVERAGNRGAAEKNGTGELRSDIEPLVRRFGDLSGSPQVRWMSGTYGDPRNPGPSMYWIDAVITLDPVKVAQLTGAYAPVAAQAAPDVVKGLRPHLPPGPFKTSEALDTAFEKQEGWGVTAYLDTGANILVLVAQGT